MVGGGAAPSQTGDITLTASVDCIIWSAFQDGRDDAVSCFVLLRASPCPPSGVSCDTRFASGGSVPPASWAGRPLRALRASYLACSAKRFSTPSAHRRKALAVTDGFYMGQDTTMGCQH